MPIWSIQRWQEVGQPVGATETRDTSLTLWPILRNFARSTLGDLFMSSVIAAQMPKLAFILDIILTCSFIFFEQSISSLLQLFCYSNISLFNSFLITILKCQFCFMLQILNMVFFTLCFMPSLSQSLFNNKTT